MTLIVKPRGRGNWHLVTIEISGLKSNLFAEVSMSTGRFTLEVGMLVSLGDRQFWIHEVRP